MFEKELEVATREENKCFYLAWGVNDSIDRGYEKIAIKELSFIYSKNESDKLADFRKQLDDAKISEFVLTDKSTALMSIIHALGLVCIEMDGLYVLRHEDKWRKGNIIETQGILMKVKQK